MNKTLAIVSGFFNPLHAGHIRYIQSAKFYGDNVWVIVNNDEQVKLKGSTPFLCADERHEIVSAIKDVDLAFISQEQSTTSIYKTLEALIQFAIGQGYNTIKFCKGGDRTDASKMPDQELWVCQRYNVEIVYGVGGSDKINSSSEILKKVKETCQ